MGHPSLLSALTRKVELPAPAEVNKAAPHNSTVVRWTRHFTSSFLKSILWLQLTLSSLFGFHWPCLVLDLLHFLSGRLLLLLLTPIQYICIPYRSMLVNSANVQTAKTIETTASNSPPDHHHYQLRGLQSPLALHREPGHLECRHNVFTRPSER